jgi:hypothetical protein
MTDCLDLPNRGTTTDARLELLYGAQPAADTLATMSGFFEAPPPQPTTESREPRLPVWYQAPRGELPCAVPLGEVFARNYKAVVGLAGGLAYTTGFELSFYAFALEARPEIEPFDREAMQEGDLPDEILRVGLEYSDGSKLMSTNPRRWPDEDESDEAEDRPTMRPQRGTGWHREWRHDFWCWPLPPPGPLQLVCEWPAMEIALTRYEIDAQLILDAAARAQKILPSD